MSGCQSVDCWVSRKSTWSLSYFCWGKLGVQMIVNWRGTWLSNESSGKLVFFFRLKLCKIQRQLFWLQKIHVLYIVYTKYRYILLQCFQVLNCSINSGVSWISWNISPTSSLKIIDGALSLSITRGPQQKHLK